MADFDPENLKWKVFRNLVEETAGHQLGAPEYRDRTWWSMCRHCNAAYAVEARMENGNRPPMYPCKNKPKRRRRYR